jgi:voltage-gated potassium channel
VAEPVAVGNGPSPSNTLDVDDRSRRVAKRFELPIMIAALLVVPVIAVEQSDLGNPWQAIASALNWAIWIAFAIELAVMLWIVPDRKQWLLHHPIELVVVLLTPPFLPASLQGARALRLLRLLRLIRVAQLARTVFSLEGLRWASLLAVMTALGGGAAFSYAEGSDLSTWDGVWWAMTTMTTVGYGDIYPHTQLGRLIAVAVMVIGIGFIAILTAALAERFLSAQVEEEAAIVTSEVEQAEESLLLELRAVTARRGRR